jgi:intracellular sulfur oxidation DsrE/DsrF family protein
VIFHVENVQGLEKAMLYAEKLCEQNAVCGLEILAANQAIKGLLSSEDHPIALQLHRKGVKFLVCENSMKELEITNAELLSLVTTVPFGILTLIEKQEEGYAYIRI